MRRIKLIFAFIFFALNGFAQIKSGHITEYREPDFKQCEKNKYDTYKMNIVYDRKVYYQNKNIYIQVNDSFGNILYEHFYLNDSMYHFREYFSNKTVKEEGNYIVTNFITCCDTQLSQDINTGLFDTIVYCHTKLYKTGEWKEYPDSSIHHRRCWQGNYVNNKKIGIWTFRIQEYYKTLYERNYSGDSTLIYKYNLITNISKEELEQTLYNKWDVNGLNFLSRDFTRISNCKNKQYGCSYCYIEFKKNKKFNAKGIGKKNDALSEGTYDLIKENNEYYLILSTVDKKKKFKIIYFDDDGHMLLEEAK